MSFFDRGAVHEGGGARRQQTNHFSFRTPLVAHQKACRAASSRAVGEFCINQLFAVAADDDGRLSYLIKENLFKRRP